MLLIVTGCEHVGKTTLANGISRWLADATGYSRSFHDHFTIPSPEVADADHMLVGFHIEEAVFAPLYHGYGGPSQPGDRSSFARRVEQKLMASSPDFILVLLKAKPEVIVQRMRDEPMPRDQKGRRPGLLKEEDVEYVLQRFDEEFGRSLIRKKFIIDNSDLTSEETLSEFVFKVQKYLSQSDRTRILTRQAMVERGDARDPVFEGDKTVPPEQRVKL